VNAAAELAESGVPVARAARVLADRFGVSTRQGRRYLDRAAVAGRVAVPQASVVFTVKLPVSVAGEARAHAVNTGVTISAVVAHALAEHLRRSHGRSRAGE